MSQREGQATGSSKPNKAYKVAHSLADLEDELILTLKDKPILLRNANQLNEDSEDELQNEQIQQNNRFKHNAQVRSKIKDLGDVTKSHILNKQSGEKGLLPHYDDYQYQNDVLEIDESKGVVKQKRQTKRNFARHSDFQSARIDSDVTKLGQQYDLSSKVKFNSRNRKKNDSKSDSKDLLNFLNDTAQDQIAPTENGDLKDVQNIYDEAIESIRKKRVVEYNSKRQSETVDISSILGDKVNEEEELLNRAISKAQKKNNEKLSILSMIKEQEEDDKAQGENNDHIQSSKKVEIQLNPVSYRTEDKKYRRSDGLLQGGIRSVQGQASGTTSAMFLKLPSERLKEKKEDQNRDQLSENMKDFTPEELEKMKQELKFMEDKQLGTGLAHTLAYLRENSLLGHEQEVGRYTDKNSSNVNNPGDRIKLEYRNASGKLMKPKEAFRYLCATFHGEGPGKNKVEKRKRRELEEMRVKERANNGGQLMGLLGEHQRKSQESYMVLDLGGKNISSANK